MASKKKQQEPTIPSFEAVVGDLVVTYEVVMPHILVPGVGKVSAADLATEEYAEVAAGLIAIGSGALKQTSSRELTDEERGVVDGDAPQVVSMEEHQKVLDQLEEVKEASTQKDATIATLNKAIDALQPAQSKLSTTKKA
jgi:hypothetical protein